MTRNYTVTPYKVTITDSFEMSKHYFERMLRRIKMTHPDSDVWKRSWRSLKAEWICHNFAYDLGIRRDKTRTVDFEYPQKWWVKAGYWTLGGIAWLFIK